MPIKVPFVKSALAFVSIMTSTLAGTVDPKIVQDVEGYLNGIKSYRATINQTTDSGEKRTGLINLLRDGKNTYGKLRIEYAPPIRDLFIVDGEKCRFYDFQAKEAQEFNVNDTPASFLLSKKIDLKGKLKVIDQTTDSNGDVNLKIVRSGDESGSYLTLKFSVKPFLKMNGWTVQDPQGITQEIHLEDVTIGVDLDPKLFKFD